MLLSISGKEEQEAMATPTNRPSFDRRRSGLNSRKCGAHFGLVAIVQARDKGEDKVRRKKVLLATATIKYPSLRPAQIDAGARVCYESFARDVGHANRARFVAFDKLKEHQKTGWRRLAEEVAEARMLFVEPACRRTPRPSSAAPSSRTDIAKMRFDRAGRPRACA